MGAGAIGSYFGGVLARAGAPVVLIGRPAHVRAFRRRGLVLHTSGAEERIRVSASTSPRAAADADVVLLSVKTPDTEPAALAMSPHLRRDAIVVSLQNGVDNVERIRKCTGREAVPAAVYVAVAMSGPGAVRHSGRGDLIIGDLPGQSHDLDPLRRLFEDAGIPCLISEDIEGELWRKLVMNCAYNAISALTHQPYGRIVADPGLREVMADLVAETVAVARKAGIRIPDDDPLGSALELGRRTMSDATSSTEQDIRHGRKTEIDSLNGFVAARGAQLGVPTPVNRAVHALVNQLSAHRGQLNRWASQIANIIPS